MIASITGTVAGKNANYIVVESGGIGYKIFATPALLELPIGSRASIHTYMNVREDAIQLFGFESHADLEFFELLLTVSGVGPKVALSIISAQNTALVQQAIADGDSALFTKIGGVGRKTAEKIIVELKDKIGLVARAESATGGGSQDFISALEHLGYSAKEIRDVAGKIDRAAPTEEKLRQALKLLAGK